MASNTDFNTTPDESDDDANDITVTLTYDDSSVTGGTEDSLHIYVLVQDDETGAIFPLMGDLDVTTNTITVKTKGFLKKATFTVVYNPNRAAIASDDTSVPTLLDDESYLTASTWPTNVWCVTYDPTNAELKTVAASLTSGATADTITAAQIRTVLATYVASRARRAGNDFQTLGLRAPYLYLQSSTAGTRSCSGTTSSVYFVHMGDSSKYIPSSSSEPVDLDSLSNFGSRFGQLLLDYGHIDGYSNSTDSGTSEDVVTHEMLHAVQSGYELTGAGFRMKGIKEGSAATVGKTFDGSGTTTSEPQVRTLKSTEIFPLAAWLMIPNSGWRYSNQDFFAYVARKYNSNSYDFLPTFYAAIRNRVAALSTAAERSRPPYATIYTALDDAMSNGIDSSLTLKDAYFQFAVDRLVEHSSDSQFGRSGEVTTAGTLATDLLIKGGLQDSLSGDPDTLNVTEVSNAMLYYTTRVFQVIPTSVSDDSNGVRLTVTITPSSGSVGTDFYVKYYRAGSAAGTTVTSSSFEVANWGKTTSDQIIVVVSQLQDEQNVVFTYKAETSGESSTDTASDADASTQATAAFTCLSSGLGACTQPGENSVSCNTGTASCTLTEDDDGDTSYTLSYNDCANSFETCNGSMTGTSTSGSSTTSGTLTTSAGCSISVDTTLVSGSYSGTFSVTCGGTSSTCTISGTTVSCN